MQRLLLLGLLVLAVPAQAQRVPTAHVFDWPGSAHAEPVPDRHWRNLDILPFIERLSLTLDVREGDRAPVVEARVSWQIGREGIKRGRRVPARDLPAGVSLVAFVLRGDIIQEGARVAGFTLAVDSTRLRSGETLVLSPEASWASLFDEVDESMARQIVKAGFSIENLRLVRAAFGVFNPATSSASDVPRERMDERSVYDAYPDVWIEVAWDLAWLMHASDRPAYERRRSLASRGASGRDGKSRDTDEEEEEDPSGELLPAAVMVGAALVTGAVLSGSAGYVAQADEPIGLATGVIRQRGGLIVQGSVNPAALGLEQGDESLTAQVIGFFGGPRQIVQPAVGFGVRYHERAGAMQLDPAVTFGGMVRLGQTSLLAGYEVVGNRPSFGLIYAWRMN